VLVGDVEELTAAMRYPRTWSWWMWRCPRSTASKRPVWSRLRPPMSSLRPLARRPNC